MDWMPVLITSGTIGGVGLACGSALALAAKFLSVPEDPKVAELEGILPGVNCGGCGFAGCADYAKAIATGAATVDQCAPGGPEVLKKLAAAMGQVASVTERQVAIVLCQGNEHRAVHKHVYNGVADCSAAAMVAGGDMLCTYGCLGYGSCAFVCPVGAIEIKDNLATVHPELCIGCKACVKACPRGIIRMVPESRSVHVLCSSKDKGPVAKKACQVACIGCKMCVKLGGEAFEMDGFLAKRNYAIPATSDTAIEKCPGKCIVKIGASEAALQTAPTDGAHQSGSQA